MKLKYPYMNEAGEGGAGGGGAAPEGERGLMAEHLSGQEPQAEPQDAQPNPLQFEERPEWLDEQFYDHETKSVRLESMAKSYKDFRKMARENDAKKGVPEKPDEYTITAPDGFTIDDSDPIIAKTKEVALQHGVSKEGYDAIMSAVMADVADKDANSDLDLAREKEKLGPNADKLIADLANNFDRMVDIGLFGEQDREAAIKVAGTADGVKMFNKLFNHYQQRPGIPVHTAVPEGKLSKQELDMMVGSEEYNTNPAFREKVRKGYEALYGKQ